MVSASVQCGAVSYSTQCSTTQQSMVARATMLPRAAAANKHFVMRKGGAGSKWFGEYRCSTQLMRDIIGSAGCCNRCHRQCVACSFGQSRHPRSSITLDDEASVWREEQRSSERGAHQQRLFHHPHTVSSRRLSLRAYKSPGFAMGKDARSSTAHCASATLRSLHSYCATHICTRRCCWKGSWRTQHSVHHCALIQFISPLTHSRESPGVLVETNPEAPLANHRLARLLFISRPASPGVACCRLSLIQYTHSARSP